MKNKISKRIFGILVIGVLLANVKSILNDYDVDSGYAVAMAYRMVNGDDMLSEMWEPHQTSAFLCAALIKLYLSITGTITGIVLYLQVAGVFIRGIFLVFFYLAIKPFIRKDMLYFMCLFFFSITPKWIPLPEFSNMLIWFSIGIFCSLIRYVKSQNKKGWLILTGLFLCLAILAYPSCIIMYIGIIMMLLVYVTNKWKSLLILTGVCVCSGVLYVTLLWKKLGVEGIITNVQNILSSDSSHQKGIFEKMLSYIKECWEIALFLLIIAGISMLVLLLVGVIGNKREIISKKIFWIAFFGFLFLWDILRIINVNMDYHYKQPIHIVIILLGMLSLKYCTETEKMIVKLGWIVSFLDFFSVLLLTNLDVMSIVNYLILAIMVSFIPIIRRMECEFANGKEFFRYIILFGFCGLTIFRCGYLAHAMNVQKLCVFDVRGIVKDGPAVGIISEYMGPHMLNTTLKEWEQYISAGDNVLIVSTDSCDPIQYLFEDVNISAASTLSTPTYDENLLEYWTQNPEKYPNVIIVNCWDGKLNVDNENWIMQWINTEYPKCRYVDGAFWRYYFIQEEK